MAVWHPYKIKHKIALENIQRRATKELPSTRDLSYIHGIEEKEGEDTSAIVIAVVQQKLGLNHIGTDQLECSHRIGPKLDEKGSPLRTSARSLFAFGVKPSVTKCFVDART